LLVERSISLPVGASLQTQSGIWLFEQGPQENEAMTRQHLKVAIAVGMATLGSDPSSAEELERYVSDPSILAENAAIELRTFYQDCLDNYIIDYRPRLHCTDKEYAFQDARLNATYKRLMQSLRPPARAKLKAEERKWILKKLGRCDFGVDARPDDVVAAADCEVRESAKRATELERRLTN
jgi:uncharacterized protein YecT (DUF1311 family)